jgi:hypothetical protein
MRDLQFVDLFAFHFFLRSRVHVDDVTVTIYGMLNELFCIFFSV